jgi:hypothetical protein
MSTARAWPLLVALSLVATGCAGGGAVRFRGSVVGSPVPGAQYEERPADGPAVPAAIVRVCHCHNQCVCDEFSVVRTAKVDASGRYEVPEFTFATGESVANVFIIQADAPGYERVHYTLEYDNLTDQERAERARATFLNFRMRRSPR